MSSGSRIALVMFAQALSVGAVLGREPVNPQIQLTDMRVVVSYVSTGVLMNLQQKYGAYIDRRDIRQSHRHGFSILRTNRETGAVTCEIYMPNERRPREVDDEATLVLGHELLHCMHGDYHR